jgi:glycerol-1-phosphate dehydrogenase [NAD(P)+]
MDGFTMQLTNKIWNLPTTYLMPFSEIHEKRPVLLVTSSPAWNAVKNNLHFQPVAKVEVTEANTNHWDTLLSTIHAQPVVVYAVGGGLVADASKYLAVKLGLPMVCLPTALSVDAFITGASGIRKDGCVYYIETRPPETLILDLEVIAAAPASIRAAGITDVMSIATGSWDWQFAHAQHRNPPGMEFIPWVYDNAQSILNGVLDCAEAAGRGDPHGLKTLYDCLCMEVQLCNQLGHSRPEEGSEHYFAYAVENEMGHGLPHGDLVGPGIMLFASRQGQNTNTLQHALSACSIPLDHIPPEMIQHTLAGLPAYCQKHNLPFAITHTLENYSNGNQA